VSSSDRRIASHTTSFRLTPEEFEALRQAAAKRGQGPSTFARAATLRASGRPAPAAKRKAAGANAEALARLLGEMGRIGGLMKVLTMQAREGRVDAAALDRVGAEWQAVRQAVMALTDEGSGS
jgi:hypothetical protein